MRRSLKATLPKTLMPNRCSDLVRLGRRYDGGYIVRESDINCTRLLLSFGINDDWSFEKEFIEINNVPLAAYDGSVSYEKYIRKLISGVFTFYKVSSLVHRIKVVMTYHKFFSDNRIHVPKFVGPSELQNVASVAKILEDASSFLKINDLASPAVFLKVDVEGAEYRILDDIVKYKDILSGLAIEFHDCQNRLSEIIEFLREVNLSVVHVHVNNFSSIDPDGLPSVLELTLSSNPVSLEKGISDFARRLDMPNTKKRPDIEAFFSE